MPPLARTLATFGVVAVAFVATAAHAATITQLLVLDPIPAMGTGGCLVRRQNNLDSERLSPSDGSRFQSRPLSRPGTSSFVVASFCA